MRAPLEPFGLAFTKVVARRLGLNPVFYIDLSAGYQSALGRAFDMLRATALNSPDFHAHPAAGILPFIEGMGRWDHRNSIKEFSWEREWRHRGHLQLPDTGLIWLCPEDRIRELQERVQRDVYPWIDPDWGLERIIAHLAGIQATDVSPFEPPRVPVAQHPMALPE